MSAAAAPSIRRRRPLLPTPANDAVVREAYDAYRRHGDRNAIKTAAAQLGCWKWEVNKRAKLLGLARAKEAPWSAAELELLEREARYTPDNIALKFRRAGFQRTPTAINLKLKRTRLRAGVDGYSATKLATALGVDTHLVVRWTKFGWIKGARRGTHRTAAQGGDEWYFAHEAVYEFVMRHPDEVDLCKVEKFWFLDLVTQGKICR